MLRTRLNPLGEDVKVRDRLLGLLDEVECSGQQIHDADVVATMLVHGIETVIANNVDDFNGFGYHIHVVGLHPSGEAASRRPGSGLA